LRGRGGATRETKQRDAPSIGASRINKPAYGARHAAEVEGRRKQGDKPPPLDLGRYAAQTSERGTVDAIRMQDDDERKWLTDHGGGSHGVPLGDAAGSQLGVIGATGRQSADQQR
jgi:hypothetical protein